MGLIEELKRGDSSAWLEAAAVAEGIGAEELAGRVLDGTAVIVANVSRRDRIRPVAVGAGLRTK
ncbi:MAG: phosphomethylpyrimidine synthase ThiC, partial [Coriobacteriia bacterium]|nr:phosphomethylpyrimidine synthase ThiC [Coriobacteriia bacterium]